MELPLTPDVEAKLDQLSCETGRKREDFVRDALAGYFAELAQVRGMLDCRYDDLKSGRVASLSGKQVVAHFSRKSDARHT